MKANCRVTKLIKFLLVAICFFYLTACGLDSYVVVDAPVSNINVPDYSNIDKTLNYFEFWTNETYNATIPEFKFLGTEVYYKIYSNYSTMTSERDALRTLADSSTSSATAPDKLVNSVSSGGYGFKQLQSSNYNSTPLIKATGSNQKVHIRLTDYQDSSEYAAIITVDGNYLQGSTESTIPLRILDDLTFNFGRSSASEKNKVPVSADEDVSTNTTVSSLGKWYVSMFAVSVGRDVTYSLYRSNILYLGSVTIDQNSYDN